LLFEKIFDIINTSKGERKRAEVKAAEKSPKKFKKGLDSHPKICYNKFIRKQQSTHTKGSMPYDKERNVYCHHERC
jgi:hypothetical protein